VFLVFHAKIVTRANWTSESVEGLGEWMADILKLHCYQTLPSEYRITLMYCSFSDL
jgi:hypothetical protein